MRRVLQNLIIAFTVIIFVCRHDFYIENQNMWKQVDSIQVT